MKTNNAAQQQPSAGARDVRPAYLEALALVERVHHGLLEVVKDEFDRRNMTELNSTQALLLFNIGDKELTSSELRTRGYYLGSNVSYNVKKLVELGYLRNSPSRTDRRAALLTLTHKGKEVCDIVAQLYDKHAKMVECIGGVSADDFAALNKSLSRLERFWSDQIRYRM